MIGKIFSHVHMRYICGNQIDTAFDYNMIDCSGI
jgi:hypothetical protein